jgi:hypothetical protein
MCVADHASRCALRSVPCVGALFGTASPSDTPSSVMTAAELCLDADGRLDFALLSLRVDHCSPRSHATIAIAE